MESSKVEIKKMLDFLESHKNMKKSEKHENTFYHVFNEDMFFLGNDRIIWQRDMLQIPIYCFDDLDVIVWILDDYLKLQNDRLANISITF